MSRSTVQYGDTKLTDVRISISEDFLYDSDERTLLGTNYTVNCSGFTEPAATVPLFREKLDTLRINLSRNAQRLLVWDQDTATPIVDLNPDAPAGATTVHDWGPQVRRLAISELVGLRSAHYNWTATAFRKDCGNASPNGILSVQRTYSYSIDVCGYATRSVAGSLKVTKQMASADQFRAFVTPPLPSRFRRIQQQFSTSPDGRTLTFNISDQEEHTTLPTGVADGEATWGVKVADLGARVFYVLNGRLKGAVSTPKSALFSALLQIMTSRFPLGDPALIFEEASVDDAVFGNEISFSILASSVVGTLGTGPQIFNSLFAGMTKKPPDNGGLSYLVGPYGDLPGQPHIAPLFPLRDACSVAGDGLASSPASIEASREGGVPIADGAGAPDTVPQDNVSAQHLATPFVEFVERIGYHFDYKQTRFDQKSDGGGTAAPTFTQSSDPSVIATQVGCMKVYAKSSLDVPAPPAPIWPSGRFREAYVMPDVGQPVADGVWRLYTVHWRYVIEWPAYVGPSAPGDAFVAFPNEPRLGPQGTSQGSLAGKMPWLNGT